MKGKCNERVKQNISKPFEKYNHLNCETKAYSLTQFQGL
jgi:hypothetical protein